MNDKHIAVEATHWYIQLEKVEKDPDILPSIRKLLQKYIKGELIRIRKEIKDDQERIV